LENKLILPLFFAILGFVISFLISVISGSSIVGVLVRSIFSAIILGGLGYLLVFLLDKFSEQSSNNTQNEKIDINKENYNENFRERSIKTESFHPNYDENEITENRDNKEFVSEEDKISYEELFTKLKDNENLTEKIDSRIDKNMDVDKEKGTDTSNKKSYDLYKKDVIDEMNYQKDKESVEIDLSNNAEIIEGDSDLNSGSISADDAAKITATSKMSTVVGEVKGIDDKYIYFTKGSKIENKPEKIAKVIKEMLKNE